MSYLDTKRVYDRFNDRTETTMPEQALLLALAHCRNQETGQCNPGSEHLMDMAHFSEPTLKAAKKSLQKKGFIRIVQGHFDRKTHRNVSTSYELCFPPRAGDPPRCDPVPPRLAPETVTRREVGKDIDLPGVRNLAHRGVRNDPLTENGTHQGTDNYSRLVQESLEVLRLRQVEAMAESFHPFASQLTADNAPSVRAAIRQTAETFASAKEIVSPFRYMMQMWRLGLQKRIVPEPARAQTRAWYEGNQSLVRNRVLETFGLQNPLSHQVYISPAQLAAIQSSLDARFARAEKQDFEVWFAGATSAVDLGNLNTDQIVSLLLRRLGAR